MHRSSLAILLILLGPACGSSSTSKPDAAAGQPDAPMMMIDAATSMPDAAPPKPRHKAIVFVWDGLRPDEINMTDTPRLATMRAGGVSFTDNHSTYPTFTMMNSASFATGGFPAQTGFFGNTLWQPGPHGADSAAKGVDFQQPVFTEDYAIIQDLDAYYGYQLTLVGTLFMAAQQQGLVTAAIGKSGAAFLQDYRRGGYLLDEKMVYPLSLVEELQSSGMALPKLTPNAYPAGIISMPMTNGDPTASAAKVFLADGVTTDPTDAAGAPSDAANAYMMNAYLDHILATKSPDLTLIWFRNPDSTEHAYGVGGAGVPNYKDALHAQDALLGLLLDKITMLGIQDVTDVIVVSDHGHSNVSGDFTTFPLRAIAAGTVGAVDAANGYSASGDVRMADLLHRAGFTAYDGVGCTNDPVISGMKADGTTLYPQLVDTDGSVCGMPAGKSYVTPSYKVPATLPAHAIVIAANGGSDYLYIPDHDATTVQNAVRFLQSREEVGAIFVSSALGAIPGTLPLDMINLEDSAGRHPDIVFSYVFDENAMVQGVPGIEYESAQGNRGMHGSFSPRDVHNTLIAFGPDFKAGFSDPLPSGNVDVAPTVAHILQLDLPQAAGRPLYEALVDGGASQTDYMVAPNTIHPAAQATGLTMKKPTSPDGTDVDAAATHYSIDLKVKVLTKGGSSWTYFDSAKAVRN
jgi:arylsulfatase A-like enzyme